MAEKEYIERIALIDNTNDRYTLGEIGRMERDIIVNALKYVPAADVRENVHGRWIKPVPGDGEPHCSECGQEAPSTGGCALNIIFQNTARNAGLI